MADTKDYITRLQDDGAIHISEDVIASIAAAAITEVEGVCGLSANLGSDLAEMLGKKSLSKGVRLTVGEQDEIVIDCNVVVLFGHPMMELAQNIQNVGALKESRLDDRNNKAQQHDQQRARQL